MIMSRDCSLLFWVLSLTFLSPLRGLQHNTASLRQSSESDLDNEAFEKWLSRQAARRMGPRQLLLQVSTTTETRQPGDSSSVVLPDCEAEETLNTICVFRLSDAFDSDMQEAFSHYTRAAKLSRRTFMDGFEETKKWVSQQLHKAAKECDYHMHTVDEAAKTCYHTHEGIVFAAADDELLEATEARLASTNEAFSDLEAIKVELAQQFAGDLKEKCCEVWDDDDDYSNPDSNSNAGKNDQDDANDGKELDDKDE